MRLLRPFGARNDRDGKRAMGRSRIFAGPLNMQIFGTFVERDSGRK